MKRKKLAAVWITAGLLLSACVGQTDEEAGVPAQTKEQTQSSAPETEQAVEETGDEPEEAGETEEKQNEPEKEQEQEKTDTEAEQNERPVNNGGHFVQLGDKIYFLGPTQESMEDTALFGEYLSTASGKNALYVYDTVSGETQEVCRGDGTGVWVSGGRIYLQKISSAENDLPGVVRLEPGQTEPEEVEEGYLLGGDREGKYVAAIRYKEGNETLFVFEGETKCLEMQLDDYSNFAGIAGDTLIYQTADYDQNIYTLKGIKISTGEVQTFGELPQSEYTPAGMIDQFEEENGHIYMTYGFYEGTGHFFAGAYLLEAVIGGENSLKAEEMPDDGEEIPEKSPAILIKDGKAQVTDGIPQSAGLLAGSGRLGYYDENGKSVEVTDGYAYQRDEENDIVTDTEIAEFLDGCIYLVQNVQKHVPEEDIGWREAYRRLSTKIVKIDVTTKEEETILSFGDTVQE